MIQSPDGAFWPGGGGGTVDDMTVVTSSFSMEEAGDMAGLYDMARESSWRRGAALIRR